MFKKKLLGEHGKCPCCSPQVAYLKTSRSNYYRNYGVIPIGLVTYRDLQSGQTVPCPTATIHIYTVIPFIRHMYRRRYILQLDRWFIVIGLTLLCYIFVYWKLINIGIYLLNNLHTTNILTCVSDTGTQPVPRRDNRVKVYAHGSEQSVMDRQSIDRSSRTDVVLRNRPPPVRSAQPTRPVRQLSPAKHRRCTNGLIAPNM